MKFSVIIPVYNASKHIFTPIESLLRQSFKDFEVIIVDDGSEDDSVELISAMVAGDERFRLISQVNAGPGAARNKGVQESKGEYISFLDSDDYFHDEFLEKMNRAAVANDSDIVVSDFVKVDTEGNVLQSYLSKVKGHLSSDLAFRDIMQSLNITSLSQNKVFRATLFQSVSFPEGIVVNEDTATIYRLVLAANGVVLLNEVLFYYVQHRSSSMNSFNKSKLDDRLRVAGLIYEYFSANGLLEQNRDLYVIYYLLNVILSGLSLIHI